MVLLYAQALVGWEYRSEYLEALAFFSLGFIVVLILGNSFNNYKKDIKRSSLIKDVSGEIISYL